MMIVYCFFFHNEYCFLLYYYNYDILSFIFFVMNIDMYPKFVFEAIVDKT